MTKLFVFISKHEQSTQDKDIEITIEALARSLDIDRDGQISFKDFYMFFSL
jgi:hypothetical protein